MTACKICDLQAGGPPELEVYADDEWRALVPPDFARPGCVWLMTKRHVEGLAHLTDAQVGGFGRAVRCVSAALERVLGAERVYVVGFGENFPHVHALLIARPGDVNPGDRGTALVAAHMTKGGDVAAAGQAVAAMRDELSTAGASAKVE